MNGRGCEMQVVFTRESWGVCSMSAAWVCRRRREHSLPVQRSHNRSLSKCPYKPVVSRFSVISERNPRGVLRMMACCSSGPCCQEGLVYEQQKQQHISTLILFRGTSLFCRMTRTACVRCDSLREAGCALQLAAP
jgi:hypothetical protein